jgi:UMF1 family MFS transporter
LIPHASCAEFYGFYNMLGKFSAIAGPVLMGLTGLITKQLLLPPSPTAEQVHAIGLVATRTSIISVMVLFIAGAGLFFLVDEDKAKAELASAHSKRNGH